jgi:hypothetical protein
MSLRRGALGALLFSAAGLLVPEVAAAEPAAPARDPVAEAAPEDAGSWIPAKKKSARSPAFGYVVAGTMLLALGYVPAGVVGGASALDSFTTELFWSTSSSNLDVIAIPVVGPFLYAADPKRDTSWGVESRDELTTAQILTLTSGVLQVAGLTLITVGMATSAARGPQRSNAPVFSASAHRGGPIAIEPVAIAPVAYRSGGGLSLRLTL